jgi:hypothetical protein
MCNHIYNTSGAHIYRRCPSGRTRHGYRHTRTMTVREHLHARVYYILRGTLSPAASVPHHNLLIRLPCLRLLAPQHVTLPPCLTYDTQPLTSPKERGLCPMLPVPLLWLLMWMLHCNCSLITGRHFPVPLFTLNLPLKLVVVANALSG